MHHLTDSQAFFSILSGGGQSCKGLMDISGAEERTPSRGVLLFFPFFIAKRNSLKHKRKQHVLFGNLCFEDNEVERFSRAISPEVRSHGGDPVAYISSGCLARQPKSQVGVIQGSLAARIADAAVAVAPSGIFAYPPMYFPLRKKQTPLRYLSCNWRASSATWAAWEVG